MEVLLAINVDDKETYFPPQVPPRLCYGKSYPYSRINEVVKAVKDEGLKHRYKTLKITKELLSNIPENQIYSLTSSAEFFYVRKKGERKDIVQIYKIQNVSILEPWTIEVSSSGERVIYIGKDNKNYKVLDEQLNYYIKK